MASRGPNWKLPRGWKGPWDPGSAENAVTVRGCTGAGITSVRYVTAGCDGGHIWGEFPADRARRCLRFFDTDLRGPISGGSATKKHCEQSAGFLSRYNFARDAFAALGSS